MNHLYNRTQRNLIRVSAGRYTGFVNRKYTFGEGGKKLALCRRVFLNDSSNLRCRQRRLVKTLIISERRYFKNNKFLKCPAE